MRSRPAGPNEAAAAIVREPAEARRSERFRTLRLLLNPALFVWNLFLLLASPALLAMKLRRRLKKRNAQEFAMERWSGFTPLKKAVGTRVVFMAPSYGEVVLIEPLSNAIRHARPDVEIVWAIRDPHTLSQYRSRQEIAAIPWPFDFIYPVARWLSTYDPSVLIFTERYSFPNLVVGSALWGCKLALVNGRSKLTRTGFMRTYQAWLFRSFHLLLFQAEAAARRVKDMAASPAAVLVTGNLKLDLERRDLDPTSAQDLARWLSSELGPVIVAGSTSNAEEDRFVLEAFTQVRAHTACRLLLAPRKVDRAGECVQAAAARGYTVSLRSGGGSSPADVYVLDSIGELAHAYGLGIAAYVGGSLNAMGHNVVEPLEWGVPVAYGPRRGHFQELQEACERAGLGFRVHTPRELADHWLQTLSEPAFREGVRQRAVVMLRDQRGAIERTLHALLELLPPKQHLAES